MTEINDILKIKPTKIKPSVGRLLLSEPLLDDFFFKRSVVLLTEHNSEGSFGLILNKPSKYRLHEVISDVPEFPTEIFMGGPVNPDILFFIHTRPDLLESSLKITDGLYWGGNFEEVRNLLKLGMLTNKMIRFFMGYSGWSPNQLNEELTRNAWVIATTKANEILNTAPEEFWKKKIQSLGKEYALWLNFPVNPEFN